MDRDLIIGYPEIAYFSLRFWVWGLKTFEPVDGIWSPMPQKKETVLLFDASYPKLHIQTWNEHSIYNSLGDMDQNVEFPSKNGCQSAILNLTS